MSGSVSTWMDDHLEHRVLLARELTTHRTEATLVVLEETGLVSLDLTSLSETL